MIHLYNAENDIELSLDVIGYQFPSITESGDANWYLVKLHLRQAEKLFEVTDPALEAQDLQKLLQWFKALSIRKLPSRANLGFLEPCVTFNFESSNSQSVRIGITLASEMRPSFIVQQFGFFILDIDEHLNNEEYQVVFDLTGNDFNQIIGGIELIIQKYPIRSKSW